MTLYHGTKKSNLENIEMIGLTATLSEKESNDERLNIEAVYGFDTMEEARDFMVFDNSSYDDYIVFSFEASESEIIIDPEFDGQAFAIARNVDYDVLTMVDESE